MRELLDLEKAACTTVTDCMVPRLFKIAIRKYTRTEAALTAALDALAKIRYSNWPTGRPDDWPNAEELDDILSEGEAAFRDNKRRCR